ncbi:hypothetical protein SS50377_20902 [Spironucleus salmonicida]|uniref:Uncharacterized protein n=1 Tax=Spironucleus salmonicida TaxID=348837 RepID=V6LIN1_9EUKA|nr:hypothetical protein SS50377_20902 [Spironucleus salmonicida]|eukprot:EST43576.1 Hypothetical protein SS50377_16617 [Spironucleus salmonicida]
MRYEDGALPTLGREFPCKRKYNQTKSGNRQTFLYTNHLQKTNDTRGFNGQYEIPFNTLTQTCLKKNNGYFCSENKDFSAKRALLEPQMSETLMLTTRKREKHYPLYKRDPHNQFQSEICVGNEHENKQIWDRKV